MDRKSPTDILEAEHHVIQKIIGAMAVLREGLGTGHEPPVATLRTIVEFMRTFADKCHQRRAPSRILNSKTRKDEPLVALLYRGQSA